MPTARSFTFQYRLGQSAPFKTVDAPTDQDGYKNIRTFLAENPDRKLMKGSIICKTISVEMMPDEPPSEGQGVPPASIVRHTAVGAGRWPKYPIT